MKKLIILGLTILLFSCSKSDDSSTTVNSASFNPPVWIQGTWLNIVGGLGYKFTLNNVCQINGSQQICFKEMLQMYSNSGTSVTLNESINNSTEYKFSYTVMSVSTEFHFKKGATNTVINMVGAGALTPLTKQ
jgi:hypothetical protein